MADSREDSWTRVSSVQSAETSGTFGEDSSDRDTGDGAAFHARKASDEVTSPLKEPPAVFLPSHEVLPSGHSEIEAAPEESAGDTTAQTGEVCSKMSLSLPVGYVTSSLLDCSYDTQVAGGQASPGWQKG